MKLFQTILIAIFMLLISTETSYAYQQASGSSARLKPEVSIVPQDYRSEILREFLLEYDSPLTPYAGTIVENADKYGLDWRLVASIAGLESGFGKRIPYNSYNGWGWGIYGGKVTRFLSWEEGIETISRGLRQNYLKDRQDSDPYFIGPTYAASPTWAQRVTFFMNRIESYRIQNATSTLELAS